MEKSSITTSALHARDIPAVSELILAQEIRHHTLDPHLKTPRSSHQIEAAVKNQWASDVSPLVALNAQGQVCGYAYPALWELPTHSALHTFLTSRNGMVSNLALPAPANEDAHQVATSILTALSTEWSCLATTGDLIRWPVCDGWLESLLKQYAFQLDSSCAIHPPFLSPQSPSPYFSVRPAQIEDEDALLKLFTEEILAHQPYTPFVRVNSTVLAAFRTKLERFWMKMAMEDGAPFVAVVEQEHEIIAMAEATLLVIDPDEEPGFTPLGHYICLDNIGVSQQMRGKGIGHLLIHSVFNTLTTCYPDLAGYILWYNPTNPLAQTFWSRYGFQPLWNTYQRLHPAQ